jgi:predicted RNase H-like nuclease (RuvC/YqgF family)
LPTVGNLIICLKITQLAAAQPHPILYSSFGMELAKVIGWVRGEMITRGSQATNENDTRGQSISGESIKFMLETLELKNFEVQQLKSVVHKLQSKLQALEEEMSMKDIQIKRLMNQRDEAWEELTAIRRS